MLNPVLNSGLCLSVVAVVLQGVFIRFSNVTFVYESSKRTGADSLYTIAFSAFMGQLAILLGMAFCLGTLDRSRTMRQGKAAQAVRLMYDCICSWALVTAVTASAYGILASDVAPLIVCDKGGVRFVRYIEWTFTVPHIWYLYARMFTGATLRELNMLALILVVMIVVGWPSRIVDSPLLYWILVLAGCGTHLYHAAVLYSFPPHESKHIQACGRVVFLIGQVLMLCYPLAWICTDLNLISLATEEKYIFTILDLSVKFVLMWGCCVLRLYLAFPALHVSIDSVRQCLDSTYDIRLILDHQFWIYDIDGSKTKLKHYLNIEHPMEHQFFDLLHGEVERQQFLQAARQADRADANSVLPKVSLTFRRAPEVNVRDTASRQIIGGECAISPPQYGLRVVAINLHELNGSEALRENVHMPRCQSVVSSSERSVCSEQPSVARMPSAHERNSLDYFDSELEPALLLDTTEDDPAIFAASGGFLELTNYTKGSLVGSPLSCLWQDLPRAVVSASDHKQLRSYVRACRSMVALHRSSSKAASEASEVHSRSSRSVRSNVFSSLGRIHLTQPIRSADDSAFVSSITFSSVDLGSAVYVIAVFCRLGDGLSTRLDKASLVEHRDNGERSCKRISVCLRSRFGILPDALSSSAQTDGDKSAMSDDDDDADECNFSFYDDRLDKRCILFDFCRSARRLEAEELPTGCLVFSDRPVRMSKDGRGCLRFSVLVNEVNSVFDALPLLGFTKRRPLDDGDCYPNLPQCLGCSVLIGKYGEAFARDQTDHASIGFQAPPQTEIQTWSEQNYNRQASPSAKTVVQGDVLTCEWSASNRLTLYRNEDVLLSFNIGRKPNPKTAYYAVIDVSHRVSQVTCHSVPVSSTLLSQEPSQPSLERCVLNMVIHKTIANIVADCKCNAIVGDPSLSGCQLIAVSQEFIRTTNFERSEVLGCKCRLSDGFSIAKDHEKMTLMCTKEAADCIFSFQKKDDTGSIVTYRFNLAAFKFGTYLDSMEDMCFVLGVHAGSSQRPVNMTWEQNELALLRVASSLHQSIAGELGQNATKMGNDRFAQHVHVLAAPQRICSTDVLARCRTENDACPTSKRQSHEGEAELGDSRTGNFLSAQAVAPYALIGATAVATLSFLTRARR